MDNDRQFVVPQYYDSFRCKMGACRQSCCQGWPIALSRREYYRVSSLAWPRALRRRLDSSICILDAATADRYAAINPDMQGECPLHGADGLCRLQGKGGAEALPQICRLYPRGIRTAYRLEAGMANSCEGVVEMLADISAPLTFSMQAITDLPPADQLPVDAQTAPIYVTVRSQAIALLQDRRLPISHRLSALGRLCQTVDAGHDVGSVGPEPDEPSSDAERRQMALIQAWDLLESFADRNDDLCLYIDAAMANGQRRVLSDWELRCARFDDANPGFQVLTEQLIVNHVWFSGFPFAHLGQPAYHAWLALVAGQLLIRLLVVQNAASAGSSLIDMLAAAYRLIEHSSFDQSEPWHLIKTHADVQTLLRL